MKKKKVIIKEIINWFSKHRSVLSVLVAVIFLALIPSLVNSMINTKPFIFPSFFGFITDENKDTWIAFYGAIISGAITLLGVNLTIVDQNNKRRDDAKDLVKPILVSENVTYEKIIEIQGNTSGAKVYEWMLTYKNIGKGILYNPSLYDLVCTIDNVSMTSAQASTSIQSYLDINESIQMDITVSFNPDTLKQFYEQFKSRGNTLLLKAVMYVGGDDLYGRTTITKLVYTKHIIWRSPIEIELGLVTGKLVSEAIFDKNEVSKIVKNRNYRYMFF